MENKELAFEIAKKSFNGKTDKGESPYINHLLRVAKIFKDDDFLYTIALLHDLLEDCKEWNEISLSCLFSENIVKTIVLLTRKKGQSYEDYIEQISTSSWATQIKRADLKDNLDISRLKEVTAKDIERLNKYINALKKLNG